MGFFGLSNAGKEAQGFPREYGAWNFQQFKDFLDRAKQAGYKGDALTAVVQDYLTKQMETGWTHPNDIRARGEEVMPGVDEALAARKANLQKIYEDWGAVPKAGDTMGAIRGRMEDWGKGIGLNYDAIQKDLEDSYKRMGMTEEEAHAATQKDIEETYGGLGAGWAKAYGGFRQKAGETYGGLKKSAEETYGTALQDIEQLRPASEAAAARTARAFAPAKAAAAGRLRSAGIDINSPQAQSILQRVETGRARSMDDALAEGMRDYISRKTELGLGRQGARERLGLGEMGTDIGLGKEELGGQTELTREKSGLTRGELARNLQARQGLEAGKTAQTIQNRDIHFQRGLDWQKAQMDADQLERAMATQDWATMSSILGQMSDEELTALNLKAQQFGAGWNWEAANKAATDQAASGLLGIGNTAYGQEGDWAKIAGGFGNTAADAYKTAYGYELPNAGWGMKAIGAVAPMGVSLIPKVGKYLAPFVGAAANSMPGGQQGGGGQYGGGWGGWNNPYVFSFQRPEQGPQSWRGGNLPNWNWYDPNKTKWNPETGALEIGR